LIYYDHDHIPQVQSLLKQVNESDGHWKSKAVEMERHIDGAENPRDGIKTKTKEAKKQD